MQEQKALSQKKYEEVLDIKFPNINPKDNLNKIKELAKQYFYQIKFLIEKHNKEMNAVHIMGEMTFVYNLVLLLQKEGITAVASTTERITTTERDGKIIKQFKFVSFRNYFYKNQDTVKHEDAAFQNRDSLQHYDSFGDDCFYQSQYYEIVY